MPGIMTVNRPEAIKRPLTPKQARFVAEYLVDLNATQAAIRAGYRQKTAAEIGRQNLRKLDISIAIQSAMDKRSAATGIEADRVLREIARLAFFDIRKLFNDDGTPKQVNELDEDTAAVISGIDVMSVGNADVGAGQVLKIRLADKLKALEQAGRHLKLFVDRVEVEVTGSLADRMKAARERIKR